MTWHLKDRELENKLIAIDPYFSEKLNRNCEMWDSNKDGDLFEFQHFMQRLTYKYKLLGEVVFSGSEIEEVSEYNPKDWNEYPKVIPPRHEPLRVEFADKSGTKAFFDDCLREYVTAKRIDRPCRYRPWED